MNTYENRKCNHSGVLCNRALELYLTWGDSNFFSLDQTICYGTWICDTLFFFSFFRFLLPLTSGAPNRRGDFHWYRRDGEFNNRRWSHKPGETIPTNKDNNGHYITDPRLAAMGHYQFVAFMTTNPNAVNINNGVYPAGCDPNQG